MSLNRLNALVYLAVAVVVAPIVDFWHVGIYGSVRVLAVADGGVVVGGLIPGAVAPPEAGPVTPPVAVQVDAPQAEGGPGCIWADRRGFGILHGLMAGVGSFRGTGKEQDEREHGRGVA